MGKIFGLRRIRLLALTVVVLGVGGGVAYATIPGAGNVYTACMLKNVGTVRLIDTSLPASNLMSHCTSLETQVSWNQGQQGPAGAQGPKGDKGDTGATGPAGSQGLKGDTGPAGAAGVQGQKGETGATGPAGANGATGATGATGAKGDTGPAGADGAPGAKGATGDPGPAGAGGAQGPQGLKGDKGDPGANGAPGPKGDTGAVGATGPAGPSGTVAGAINGVADVIAGGGFAAQRTNTGQYTITFPPGTFAACNPPQSNSAPIAVTTSILNPSPRIAELTQNGCNPDGSTFIRFTVKDTSGTTVDSNFTFIAAITP